MSQTFTNNTYAGEAFESFLRSSIQPAETVSRGLIGLHTGINDELVLPRVKLTGNIVQDYAADPTSVGDYEITERNITVRKNTVYVDGINPNEWRQFWTQYQVPATALYDFPSLPEVVRVAFIDEMVKRVANVWDANIWQGDISSGISYPNDRFTGILKKLTDAADFVDATPSGATAFTASNIVDALDAVYQALFSSLERVYGNHRERLRIFMSYKTATLFQRSEYNLSGKGPTALNIPQFDELNYFGIKCEPLANFPDDQLLLTYVDPDPQLSNLHLGVTNVGNQTNVEVARKANGSHNLYMRMDAAFGTEIAWSDEVVYYKVP